MTRRASVRWHPVRQTPHAPPARTTPCMDLVTRSPTFAAQGWIVALIARFTTNRRTSIQGFDAGLRRLGMGERGVMVRSYS
ncbi:hypothetical protein FRB95_013265 [Tulasnella sp. JGI-2019a]|nr:hypothetical protein FRB95_013265 [Tulasnella sp. JGI-2019a]